MRPIFAMQDEAGAGELKQKLLPGIEDDGGDFGKVVEAAKGDIAIGLSGKRINFASEWGLRVAPIALGQAEGFFGIDRFI